MNIGIVLVNFNTTKDTVECIRTLGKMKTGTHSFGIYVIDNDSRENPYRELHACFPDIDIDCQPTNTGFCKANNIGITKALRDGCDAVWILNNDTLEDVHALDMADVLADRSVGAVGSKIYFARGYEYHGNRYRESEKGKIFWYAGGCIDWDNIYTSHRGIDLADHGQYDREEETDFLSGCSMMIRSDVLRITGGFDEKYFAYWEDADLCMRIRKAGYRLMYAPRSVLWHKNASSSGKPGSDTHVYYQTRNRILFAMRYARSRTRFAVVRQSVRMLMGGTGSERQAVSDAVLNRWGKRQHGT